MMLFAILSSPVDRHHMHVLLAEPPMPGSFDARRLVGSPIPVPPELESLSLAEIVARMSAPVLVVEMPAPAAAPAVTECGL